jgi:hypothetical protein
MIPDDLRRKLEEMNRGPLRTDAVRDQAARRERTPARLEDLIPGETVGTPERPFYLIERPLEELFARAEEMTSEFRGVWVKGRYSLSDDEMDHEWREVIETDPARLLFLDIETLGLTATPVFLVGTMSLDADDRFNIRQLFARNYSEEPHLLAHLAQYIRDYHVIVTYNGKSFDWPYLCDRAVYHSMSMGGEPGHLDLLKETRRRWKSVLPNCQLQTLEYHVSGRRRVGDLPGNMIPEAYHRYVKTGDARQMLDVIHHNALDLVTMAELLLFILQGGDLVWE